MDGTIKQRILTMGEWGLMVTKNPTLGRARGAVMPLVFVVCLMCAIVGLGVLTLAFNARMLGVRIGADISARSAADAAVNRALYQMNEKLKVKPWDDSTLPADSNVVLLSSDATFDYAVSKNAGVYNVLGRGRSGRSLRTINATLRLYSVFDYALFAKDSLELKNSATVDWINNQPGDWPLQVGTDSTDSGAITLKNGTIIDGDVVVGIGGNPDEVIDAGAGVTITGDTYAMFSDAVLPPVYVPVWLAPMPSGGTISTAMLGVSGKYDGINLKNDYKLTITEPVMLYITGDIRLKNSAEIIIGGDLDTDNDASLIIYLAGNATFDNSSQINNLTHDATQFTLYGLDSCADIRLKNGGIFYGAVYAPNASIILDNSADVYGSIVGQSFVLRNSATFYYDAALRDRTVNDDAVRFVIHRWTEQ
jgi:hypothetical protein